MKLLQDLFEKNPSVPPPPWFAAYTARQVSHSNPGFSTQVLSTSNSGSSSASSSGSGLGFYKDSLSPASRKVLSSTSDSKFLGQARKLSCAEVLDVLSDPSLNPASASTLLSSLKPSKFRDTVFPSHPPYAWAHPKLAATFVLFLLEACPSSFPYPLFEFALQNAVFSSEEFAKLCSLLTKVSKSEGSSLPGVVVSDTVVSLLASHVFSLEHKEILGSTVPEFRYSVFAFEADKEMHRYRLARDRIASNIMLSNLASEPVLDEVSCLKLASLGSAQHIPSSLLKVSFRFLLEKGLYTHASWFVSGLFENISCFLEGFPLPVQEKFAAAFKQVVSNPDPVLQSNRSAFSSGLLAQSFSFASLVPSLFLDMLSASDLYAFLCKEVFSPPSHFCSVLPSPSLFFAAFLEFLTSNFDSDFENIHTFLVLMPSYKGSASSLCNAVLRM